MVAENCDISARLRLGDHRLPRVTESTSEYVQRTDMVGIRAVLRGFYEFHTSIHGRIMARNVAQIKD